MVTGASTADLALVLVDARKGIVEQSRRHAFLCSLLRVPHLVLCVNKMDLAGYREERFDAIARDFCTFAAGLGDIEVTYMPISALHGDNVVTRSQKMPWYEGPSLLHHLEHVHIASDRNLVDVRFPVTYVIRPQSSRHPDYRGYAGQVASGVMKPGDEVMVLPSGFTTRIAGIDTADGPVDEAYPPMSVTVRLEDELDVSRGDLICRVHNAPKPAQDIDALVCWMDEAAALEPRRKLAVKHTTRAARAVVKELQYRLDVNTLHRDESAEALKLNEIGRVRLRTTLPLLADEYRRNRTTGGFILIDEQTNRTVGAGMIINAD
jgi:bifunctional enzyme CysN/CysC